MAKSRLPYYNTKKLLLNALNIYTWYNLPADSDGQSLERVLHYKGQVEGGE